MTTYPEAVLANNPVAFFKFDEDSGDTVLDYSGIIPAAHLKWEPTGLSYRQKQPRIVRDIVQSSATVLNSAAPVSQSEFRRFPNDEFTLEVWLRISDQSNAWHTLFDFRDGATTVLKVEVQSDDVDWNMNIVVNGAAVPIPDPFVPPLFDDTLHQLVLVQDSSNDLHLYLDGMPIFAGVTSGWVFPNAGDISVFGPQSSQGSVDISKVLPAGMGAVALYPTGLDATAVAALYAAGDAYPIFTWSPSEDGTFPVQDYINVLIDWGPNRVGKQASLTIVYEDGESEAIADNGLAVSQGGFYDKWEGAFLDGGNNTLQVTGRRKDFRYQRDRFNFYIAASNDRAVSTEISPDYRACGTEVYPEGMDPKYEVIVDSQGCPIGCD